VAATGTFPGVPGNPDAAPGVIVVVSQTTLERPMDIMSDGNVLVLSGDLDVRSTMEVRAAVRDLLADHGAVVIDLSEVESVDVTALRVLAAATVQSIRDGHHLTLRSPSPAVRRLLHMSHLIRVVEVDRVKGARGVG
jgi:anti-anti-sigma factor